MEQVAARAGMVHTTISRLLRRPRYGQPQKANKGTLERLARALRVPAEWLTGERRDLPFVPEFERAPNAPSLWQEPTKSYVLFSWLMQHVDAALRRDLKEWCGDKAADAYSEWGRALLSAFGLLASSLVWREAILAESPRCGGAAVMGDDDDHAVAWLSHLLEPWTVEGAYLDADAVGRLYQGLMARSAWLSEERDKRIVKALRTYARHAGRAFRDYQGETLGADAAADNEGVPVWPSSAKRKRNATPRAADRRRRQTRRRR